MNGLAGDAALLAEALRDGRPAGALLVCPPFLRIGQVATLLAGSGIAVGGQDCHATSAGAHTGDISAAMLADAGCSAVILGHSERRQDHGETDALVRLKTRAAIAAGLLPIVCVGETETERNAGDAAAIVGRQLAGSLPAGFAGVVAYEPIWAIGTGRTPTPADVEDMHRHIRYVLVSLLGTAGSTVRILYGGSVKPDNAAGLLSVPEVGGALVGGASLSAASFLAIARVAVDFSGPGDI